jgi:small-conductance mechanosensitive channel
MRGLFDFLPPAGVVVGFIIVLIVMKFILDRSGAKQGARRFRSQFFRLLLAAAAIVLFVILLPINETLRGQLLGLLGLLFSASIALASTTLLGNTLAGVMLQVIRNFHMGDFIRVGEHFGRVSERGLFHTEIQTEDRELTTLPNLYLVTHPVTKIRPSGTIVSATVSLGYDIPRTRIAEVLLDAAGRIELEEPFVQVLELGNFSVTYRIAGLLKDVKSLLTVSSNLRSAMMDALHEADIEIVSPVFHNQRKIERGDAFIPDVTRTPTHLETSTEPEKVVFDKAEDAEFLETLRATREDLETQIKTLKGELSVFTNGPERARSESRLTKLRLQLELMEKAIAEREARTDDESD